MYSKGHGYCKHVTSPHGKENGRSLPDDCERTATVALPTAASPELLVDNHSSVAALDAFSPIFEPPLMRFENGQTDTPKSGHERSLYLAMLRPRGVITLWPVGGYHATDINTA